MKIVNIKETKQMRDERIRLEEKSKFGTWEDWDLLDVQYLLEQLLDMHIKVIDSADFAACSGLSMAVYSHQHNRGKTSSFVLEELWGLGQCYLGCGGLNPKVRKAWEAILKVIEPLRPATLS